MSPVIPNEVHSACVHRIDGALTIYTVGAERERILPLLKTKAPLKLDLSGIVDCDCAGLQLLCAAHKSAQKAGIPLEWVAPSEAISRCARLAGFQETDFQAMEGKRP